MVLDEILAVLAFSGFFEGEVGVAFFSPQEPGYLFLVELLVGEDAGKRELGGIGLRRLGMEAGEGVNGDQEEEQGFHAAW
jgi:hypothetical protein